MTVDLRCRSCDGRRTEWGTGTPGHGHQPCPVCDGTGQLDAKAVALEVARAHGTRVAAETTGLSADVVRRLRQERDGYARGRGHPTKVEMAAMAPRSDCSCVHCIDHRARESRILTKLVRKLNVDRPELGGTWRDDAACATADPDLFFPERGKSIGEALSYCRRCPVRDACLEAGMGEKHGIWGGLSERGRRRLRRVRRGKQAAA